MPGVTYVSGMKRKEIPMNGGIDQSSSITDIEEEDFVELLDFRLSRDGKRIQKRYFIDTVKDDFGEDVYGLASYRDEDDAFCLLAILESKICRKTGAGAWTDVYSFSSNIEHPVRPLEIQGKQFILNEVDSRFIHTDKEDYQVGIDAPANIPTISAAGGVQTSYDLDDDCSDLSGWTEDNTENGDVTQEAFGGVETFKFDCPSGAAGVQRARIYQDVGALPDSYTLEIKAYFDRNFGVVAGNEYMAVNAWNGVIELDTLIEIDGISVYDGGAYNKKSIALAEDTWYIIKFVVDGSVPGSETAEVFVDGVSYGTLDASNADAADDGKIQITSIAPMNNRTTYYTAYIKAYSQAGGGAGVLTGTYRYAVAFARSGNYGNQSVATKSIIAAPNFVGAGLNDLGASGSYSYATDKTIRVEIDSEGTPDTVKISYDGGTNWATETQPITATMYLNYGVTITFGAITGHTSGDYWDIFCDACSVALSSNSASLQSIPTSADPQVDQRKIYRTLANGTTFYWLATINDNTTTTYTDNNADTSLGDALEEDHEPLPSGYGKLSAWWDNRLWVSGDNKILYSKSQYPESFSELEYYVNVDTDAQNDKITGMAVFLDSLYVFKRNSVFIIKKKTGGTYGRFLLLEGVGCLAPWSIVRKSNLLIWLSDLGFIFFNGEDIYQEDISVKISDILNSQDKSTVDLITGAHLNEFNEIWWSMPDNYYATVGNVIAQTVVYNTLKSKFYRFTQYTKFISTLNVIEDSSGALKLAVGTQCGRYGEANPDTTVYKDWDEWGADAKAWKGWIDFGIAVDLHYFELEFESPNSKDPDAFIYVNMENQPRVQLQFTGATPSTSALRDWRLPKKERKELGIEGVRYLMFYVRENTSQPGDCKINKVVIFYSPSELVDDIEGD